MTRCDSPVADVAGATRRGTDTTGDLRKDHDPDMLGVALHADGPCEACLGALSQRTVTAGNGLGGPVTRTRQVILIVLLLFAAYAIYTSPAASADAVRAVWNV